MKTSVLIIAHNEEAHIEHCIVSILHQTQEADQIVLIAHNCTDRTIEIAQAFPITVIPYNGPVGITHARIEGLTHVRGDIILCIDGDSWAAKNWIHEMCWILQQGNVLVGSWVQLRGNVFGWISNFFNRYGCVKRAQVHRWIWGASVAFWGKDISRVQCIFEQSFGRSHALGLTRNPDDLWLALYMQRSGRLAVTNATWVWNHAKESSIAQALRRNRENMKNGDKMEAFFKSKGAILHECQRKNYQSNQYQWKK